MDKTSDTPEKTEEISAEEKTMDAVPETAVVDETNETKTGDAGLVKLTTQYNELNDKYLRMAAEFENFRKRSRRELESTAKYGAEKLALDVLEVLDNFERAIKNEDEKLREGLEQIHKFFLAVLSRNGIEKMNADGQPFDPNFHEAIASLPSDKPAGTIIDVAVPGYMLHDKVLRYAKVAVSAEKE